MRVKEIERTANVAWSPASEYPVYLATGTAAQQLDATFSTSAALEIYALNLSDSDLEMPKVGSVASDCRFHKLLWGPHGMQSDQYQSGVIVGGADNGSVFLWNATAMMKNEECLIEKLTKHSGAVAALDINPFKNNLLASGGSESEIYIWDLNQTSSPMTPGAKSQPPDDVTSIAWNHQVQHILGSTYAGRCVVWDLRKNEPIIKVSDSMSRIKCKLLSWHPEVATQLCLASEDDHSPVIQLWDLRFATSPLKSLENHQRGILSMAWCEQDPDLLLSCGKDNRILCWNPNSNVQAGEVIYELPTSNQWSFDVQWCKRNPGIISSCSFDGHVSIYSLMGGGKPTQPSNKIADSFPTDPFSNAPVPQSQPEQTPVIALKKAPKWLKRPCGASFGFGGKLISFSQEKSTNPQQPVSRQVHMSQVVTETDLVHRSGQLESALVNGQFAEFCALKMANSKSDIDGSIWSFMKVQFEKDPRTQYLQLLGYDAADISKKVASVTSDTSVASAGSGIDANVLAEKMSHLDPATSSDLNTDSNDESPEEQDISQVGILEGNLGPEQSSSSAFDNIGQDVDSRSESPLPIAVNDDYEGLVTQALLTANFESAVEVCLHHNKMAEAIILAIAGGPDLLVRTQKRFFNANKSSMGRLISSLVTRDFEHIVRTCDLDNWREALALALTYAKAEEFAQLCGILGSRLEKERDGALAGQACLCYICAGNVDKLVECWNNINQNSSTPDVLQDLVEKVMILRKAVESSSGQPMEISSNILAQKLSQYAELLAAQGSLDTAMGYLGNSPEMVLCVLRDRLYQALGQAANKFDAPPTPFPIINVQAQKMAAPVAAQVPRQVQNEPGPRQRTLSGFHNAQANSQFQTSTTSTGSFYQPPQPVYPGSVMQPSTPPLYNGAQPPLNAPQAVSKGVLSQKYPVHQATPAPYDPYAAQPQYQENTQPISTPYRAGNLANAAMSSQAQPLTSQPNIYNPAAMSTQHTPGAPYMSASTATGSPLPSQASFQDIKPDCAWNDPPPVAAKEVRKTEYQAPAPITQPIFGAAPQPEQIPPGAPQFGGQQQYYNPAAFQQQQQAQQQAQQQQQQIAQQKPTQPTKPVVKGPIPQEHLILEEIFSKLTKQCMASANNPQVKRKLEDVLRKLEILYDKLRENKLSSNVTLGLHQIIQAVQQYDYQAGLQYHTQLISQGNFSEISSFMPGIKMLMQTAMSMQVYVQM